MRTCELEAVKKISLDSPVRRLRIDECQTKLTIMRVHKK